MSKFATTLYAIAVALGAIDNPPKPPKSKSKRQLMLDNPKYPQPYRRPRNQRKKNR